MIAYFIVAMVFLVAAAAIGYLMFIVGYDSGWHERGIEMQLTADGMRETEDNLRDDATHQRHSAIPRRPKPIMKRSVWHETPYGTDTV